MSHREEWFDVVDHRDQVIDRQTRRVVHEQGLRHRAIHVLVFNQAGQVFLQKRAMTKDASPGLWDSSCSGHVDAGEDYDTAAQRELLEELGVKASHELQRLTHLAASPETTQEFIRIYRLQHEGPFVLDPVEIETGDWITVEALNHQIAQTPTAFCPVFRHVWTTIGGLGPP